MVVACREAHPHWGPRKLLLYLARRHPDVPLPAASTAGAVLDRHGLTKRRRKRRPPKHPGSTPLVAETPNAVWTTDYKGQFRMGDGELCYPLTVCDAHSRFVLSCHGLPSVEQYAAYRQFDRLFREYGLPAAIRSDNGTPFATQALCGLSRLSVWWIKLDIDHDRIDPGQPQQNGAHERMHKTLKAETARPPEADMAAQQSRFDAWQAEFNADRPHDALGGAVPADRYAPSLRPMPDVLPEPEYPGHYEVRYLIEGRERPVQGPPDLRQPDAGPRAHRAGGDGRRGVGPVLLRPPAGAARRADVEADGVTSGRQECKRSARSNP